MDVSVCHCSIDLQIRLVQAYWSELFVIGLAQCCHVMNLSTILTAILNHLQTRLLHGKDVLQVVSRCCFRCISFVSKVA